MTEHFRLSPSGADRWMTCHGAPRMEDRFLDSTSPSASEGTAAHACREKCLREGLDVSDLLGEVFEADGLKFEVTEEWVNYLQPGIDRIRESGGEWFIENRVSMEPWIPGGFGTLDAGGIFPDLIVIDDLKFGQGIVVDAVRNRQLMIYALGFWMETARHKTDATRFLLRIDQPRVQGRGSEWYTTLEELLVFAEEVAAAAIATLNPDAPLRPSPDACKFCRASRNSGCYALDQFILDLMGLTIEDLDAIRTKEPELIPYDKMEPERRSYVLTHTGMISSWLSNLRANALNDALKGNPVPGFKAVATLGDRTWADEAKAEEFWASKLPAKKIFDQKLKSPAKMEKIAGTRIWAKAQDLIVRPDGAPALVPESDKRDALIPLHNLLDDIDDEDDDDLIAAKPETVETVEDFDDLDDLI